MSNRIRERLQGYLNDFRAQEPAAPDWIGLPETLAVLRAWAALEAQIGEPLFLGAPPLHLHNRWAYVWKYRRVDHERLASEAKLPAETSREIFSRLVGARLIYPDGSLSAPARSALESAGN